MIRRIRRRTPEAPHLGGPPRSGHPADAPDTAQPRVICQPRNTLIVLCKGPEGDLAFAHRLPPPEQCPALVQRLDAQLGSQKADSIVLIAYGTRDAITPVLNTIHRAFKDLVTIEEVLVFVEEQATPTGTGDTE